MPVVASPAFAIRKRPEVVFTLPEYVEKGIMTQGQAEVIREAAVAHQNILIVGGTGSGGSSAGVVAHPGHLDPGDYLVAAPVAGLRVGFDDDDGSLG